MNANKVFRANARKQLGGGIFENTWLMALVACLLYSLVMSVASFISLIIGGFLIFGLNRIFLQLVRNQKNKVDIADLFCGSEHFADLLVLYLLETLFVCLWTLLFVIPGIVKSYAYAMAFYIKNDHPDYDWRRCLDESQRHMKGYKWQLFCLDFSFPFMQIFCLLLVIVCLKNHKINQSSNQSKQHQYCHQKYNQNFSSMKCFTLHKKTSQNCPYTL